MKKVFYGLAVAVVALSASAFTNAKTSVRFSTIYITGKTGSNFLYSTTPVTCPGGPTTPCQVANKPGYPLLPSGQLPIADVNSTNFNITSFRPTL